MNIISVRVQIFRTVEDAGPYDFVLPQLFVYLSICCLYRMQMGGRENPSPTITQLHRTDKPEFIYKKMVTDQACNHFFEVFGEGKGLFTKKSSALLITHCCNEFVNSVSGAS